MPVDLYASDPTFNKQGRRPAANVEVYVDLAREALKLDESKPWRVVSSRTKLAKTFFEIEEDGIAGPRRMIGKVSKSAGTSDAHRSLKLLWDAGMRPPSEHTVVEPLLYHPESGLLLQERAPGLQLIERIRRSEADYEDARRTAQWLVALQSMTLELEPVLVKTTAERYRIELMELLPEHATRISDLFSAAAASPDDSHTSVPSHGDFHPMNVYLSPDRITAIDLDTLGARPAYVDVAYFLAQTAIMGYLALDGFEQTATFRADFLEAYRKISPIPLDEPASARYIAFSLLRSLHYDFCILHSDPHQLVNPFLSAAESCIARRDLLLRP